MLKSRARETILPEVYSQRSSRKSTRRSSSAITYVEVSGSRGSAQQQHLSLAQLQHIDQNHCLLLFCTPVHPLVLVSIHSCRHDGHVYSWMYQKCLHTYMYVHVFNKPHPYINFNNKLPMFCSANISRLYGMMLLQTTPTRYG